jgi:hypothetical protein
MNILFYLKQINNDYIFFNEPIKNSIIENGLFNRLIYSDLLMSLNGLYISFEENDREKMTQKEIIDMLIELEKTIIFKIDINYKTCQYKIRDYLKHMNSRYGEDFKINKYILKISGIWETQQEYGITFKFLDKNKKGE